MFRPTSPNALQKTSVTQMGPYSIMPPDFVVEQTNLAGVLDAPMAAMATLDSLVQNNTAQYRQALNKPQGNPRTATEIQAIVAQQSALGKTQLNRYYEQLDMLFAEKYRRATNLNLTPNIDSDWDAAIRFQKRCTDRGVPKQAMLDTDYVQATRTVGQGSQLIKQQVLGALLQIAPMLPASGQQNLLEDYTAAMVGQQMVRRYVPQASVDVRTQDQVALATLELSAMRAGSPVVVTDSQNHSVHIQVAFAAANEAASSLQQGGSQHDILLFLQALAQHIQQHLQMLARNPLQKAAVEQFAQQLKELMHVIQQLSQHVQEQAQTQQKNQQMAQTTDARTQMLAAQTQAQIARENALAQAEIQRKEAVATANTQIKAASTAAKINLQTASANAE
jgi:Asp-tRNA(Asn)/Glu-tRNA(Gln) amidotransferase C subunit